MDNKKVDQVLRMYQKDLEELSYAPERVEAIKSLEEQAGSALGHALWMCEEALTWGEDRLEKKMRWLGFIQGVLWTSAGYTILELKKDNTVDADDP